MAVSQETEKKIAQLQMLEQNMQSFLMQKQAVQSQQIEVDNALEELKKTDGPSYKILGPIMISAKKDELVKELDSRKEVLSLRLKNLDKQEAQIREKAQKIQAEVMAEMKKEETMKK